MKWIDGKWCDKCGAEPQFRDRNANNPTIHRYQCPECQRSFEFDTWTKAAKPTEVSASDGL